MLVKNSSEDDLWDLSDLPADEAQEAAEPVQMLPRKGIPPLTAVPLDEDQSPEANDEKAKPPILHVPIFPRRHVSQSTNVERLGRRRNPRYSREDDEIEDLPETVHDANALEETFDNLEDWDYSGDASEDVPTLQAVPDQPAADAAAEDTATPPPPEPPSPSPELATEPAMAAEPTPAPNLSAAPEPSPKPISLRPRLGLTKIEVIGLASLALILMLGGWWVYENSLSRLASQSPQTQAPVFPVQGRHVTVTRVATYWREPIRNGEQVEAVRRGVALIPVTEITLRGGPGAIRALVYNENGQAVGDPITRPIDGETTLVLPATDGFEDISLHAAYCAGQTKPWTVRVFEAPTASAQGKDFDKLLEMPISNEKR